MFKSHNPKKYYLKNDHYIYSRYNPTHKNRELCVRCHYPMGEHNWFNKCPKEYNYIPSIPKQISEINPNIKVI